MFDDKTRVGLARQPERVRQRARRPRAGPQRRDPGAQPAADEPRPGDAQPVGPAHAAAAAVPRARADGVAGGAGRRDAGGAVRQPRHDVPGARRTSRGRSSSSRSSGGPPALDDGDRAFPLQRPFLRNSDAACSTSCAPASRALRTAAPDARRRVRDRHAGRCKRSPALNKRLEPHVRGAASASPRTRSSPLGVARPDQHRAAPQPDARRTSRPRRRSATTSTLWFRNVASLLSEGDTQRHLAAVHRRRRARTGPNNEGGPSSAPANGGVPGAQDNYLHTNPYPNTAAPGQPKECEAGNENYDVGKTGDRQRPRQPGHDPRRDQAEPEPVMAFGRSDPDAPRIPRKDRTGANPFKVGALVLARRARRPPTSASPSTSRSRTASASRPCSSRPTRSARTRRCASPASTSARSRRSSARTAPNAAVVTMEIDNKGLPIHKDATLKIRPRIFLEGNFFVDMQPGTPATPTLGDGDTLPDHADRRRRCSSTRC